MTDLTAILDCYTIEDILTYNDMTIEDLLLLLVEEELIKLPEIIPL